MSEAGQSKDSGTSEQTSPILFKDAVVGLDKKLRSTSRDSFVDSVTDLLIPQRAPADQKPMYPVSRPFVSVGEAFDSIVGFDRSPSTEDRGREIFAFLLELPELRPSNEELTEARKDPNKLKEFYTKPSVMHEVRLQDFLLDIDRANILGLWTKMSDENFQNFLSLVKNNKLPKCLTSDEEMKRLLDDSSALHRPRGTPTLEFKGKGLSVYSSSERLRLSSARERLVDLALNPDYYVKDEKGHAITPQLGGPKSYEFDPNIDILSVMDKLREEFPDEEK